jgi:hypothetical protein
LIKFPYFADTTERDDMGVGGGVGERRGSPKTEWRQGDFTDNSD